MWLWVASHNHRLIWNETWWQTNHTLQPFPDFHLDRPERKEKINHYVCLSHDNVRWYFESRKTDFSFLWTLVQSLKAHAHVTEFSIIAILCINWFAFKVFCYLEGWWNGTGFISNSLFNCLLRCSTIDACKLQLVGIRNFLKLEQLVVISERFCLFVFSSEQPL